MGRLVWIGVGAVGGVYAYRKGEQVAQTVREQGALRTAQIVGAAAVHTVAALRTGSPATERPGITVAGLRISRADDNTQAPRPAIMETDVIDITDAGRPSPGAAPRRKVR